jgi:hypothetical protein
VGDPPRPAALIKQPIGNGPVVPAPRTAEPVVGTAGQRLFARYAYGPNHLGYCGPADSAALLELATTGRTTEDVESIAARFSGAWPYLCVLAELAGVDDPLDERVVRAYWQLRRWTDWQLVVTNTRLAR